jgi:hypothetical protein
MLLQAFGNHLIFSGDGGFKLLHLLHSRGFLATDVGGIWLSLEERSPFLEEDFLPFVEVHGADTVLLQTSETGTFSTRCSRSMAIFC